MKIKYFETSIEQNDEIYNMNNFTAFEAYLHILKNSGSQWGREVKLGKNSDFDAFWEFRLTGLGCRSEIRKKFRF